ncbi:tRNA lysidine(34) synthetase TilS [Echinimonas agarilytica]|uniref:tRNA(Ile)-lysidine synthase n=1 Tax=Echinimonas agarilytica TaxID=1215918 RepID=A0AA41W591_9GAMM|nr:tRNA lysidine(34) synthetase TilS [Echinimonas agarilytica]MCM2679141.1 tRNA lysidine(34) synthetase TilS [Echinimonas agarilytica]
MKTTLFAQLDAAATCGFQHVLVALSGGKDSSAILHCASQYVKANPNLTISAIHVHHGLSPNANEWQALCQHYCDDLGVELTCESVSVTKGARQSLEALAREARYQVLARHVTSHTLMLTGHHQDDQIETFILALKRGSGLDGLSSMPALNEFSQGFHCRPWLMQSRSNIETYVAEHQLPFVEDESNQDQQFDRNFIRHSVLPLLNKRWPSFNQTASRSIQLLGSQRELIDQYSLLDMQRCQQHQALGIEDLSALPELRRNNAMRMWLRQLHAPLWSSSQLQQAWDAVALAREDAMPKLQWHGWQLQRYQGLLYATPCKQAILIDRVWNWPNKLELAGSDDLLMADSSVSAGIRPPMTGELVSVKFGCPGSLRVQPSTRSGSRPLKKVWQEYGVAPWIRASIPMIFYGDVCVAAVGYWVEKSYASQQSDCWLPKRCAEVSFQRD